MQAASSTWYVERLGLTGEAAAVALRAFEENEAGAAAAADKALQRGSNPAGLFLRMIADGDHLIRPKRVSSFSPEMCAALRELGLRDDEEPGPLTYGWALERAKGLRPKLGAESQSDDQEDENA